MKIEGLENGIVQRRGAYAERDSYQQGILSRSSGSVNKKRKTKPLYCFIKQYKNYQFKVIDTGVLLSHY